MTRSEKIDQVNTISQFLGQADFIPDWVNRFYQAKTIEKLSPRTLIFYKQQLDHFLKYCEGQVLTRLSELTPDLIRSFLLLHGQTHNQGGLHAAYRVLKTFLLWYELEAEPENWKNPIRKVKAPKLQEEPLDPVSDDVIRRLVEACRGIRLVDLRDKAIILSLYDTGARAREFLAVDLDDLSLAMGSILIRRGKGGKSRSVYMGKATRRAVKAYLKARHDNQPALWITQDGSGRLAYASMRKMIVMRARLAGVAAPSPHDFRRAFALGMLRGGCDLVTLARIMGHTNLKTLTRYLKQDDSDLAAAHQANSPVDRGGQ